MGASRRMPSPGLCSAIEIRVMSSTYISMPLSFGVVGCPLGPELDDPELIPSFNH